jgi:hypothetical protein
LPTSTSMPKSVCGDSSTGVALCRGIRLFFVSPSLCLLFSNCVIACAYLCLGSLSIYVCSSASLCVSLDLYLCPCVCEFYGILLVRFMDGRLKYLSHPETSWALVLGVGVVRQINFVSHIKRPKETRHQNGASVARKTSKEPWRIERNYVQDVTIIHRYLLLPHGWQQAERRMQKGYIKNHVREQNMAVK